MNTHAPNDSSGWQLAMSAEVCQVVGIREYRGGAANGPLYRLLDVSAGHAADSVLGSGHHEAHESSCNAIIAGT